MSNNLLTLMYLIYCRLYILYILLIEIVLNKHYLWILISVLINTNKFVSWRINHTNSIIFILYYSFIIKTELIKIYFITKRIVLNEHIYNSKRYVINWINTKYCFGNHRYIWVSFYRLKFDSFDEVIRHDKCAFHKKKIKIKTKAKTKQ